MKFTFLFAIFCCLSSICHSQNPIVIGSDYDNSFKKPIVAQRGYLYSFEADSIFLVNNQRMIMYETVINRYLLDSIDKVAHGMSQFFDQSLRRLSNEYDKMHRNANETQRISEIFIDSTRRVLNRSVIALDTAQYRLLESQKNLDLAISEIKAAKNRTWLIAVAAVLGGIGIDRLFFK